MSEYTDFYLSWQGCSAFGNTPSTAPIVTPPIPPVVFTPLDISDCYIWFNADDETSIQLAEDGGLTSFSNLGLASGAALSNLGKVSVVQDVANLNCVNFPSGSQLTFNVTLPYCSRTQFVVFNSLSDMSGATYPFLTFISGGYSSMQTGVNWDSNSGNFQYSMCQNGINCPILGTIATNPLSNPTIVTYVIDSNSSSNSYLYINNDNSNINTSPDLGNLFTTVADDYIINNPGPPGDGQSQNMCELIEYGRALDASEITQVFAYLSAKWGIS